MWGCNLQVLFYNRCGETSESAPIFLALYQASIGPEDDAANHFRLKAMNMVDEAPSQLD